MLKLYIATFYYERYSKFKMVFKWYKIVLVVFKEFEHLFLNSGIFDIARHRKKEHETCSSDACMMNFGTVYTI